MKKHSIPEALLDRILSNLLDTELYILGEIETRKALITPEHRTAQSEILMEVSAIRHELKRIAREHGTDH